MSRGATPTSGLRVAKSSIRGRALRDHGVVGHCADAVRHVGHAHRCFDELAVLQSALNELAAQVETTTGLGGCDARGPLRRDGVRAVQGKGGGNGNKGLVQDLGSPPLCNLIKWARPHAPVAAAS